MNRLYKVHQMQVYLQYEAEFRVEVTGICGYLNSPKNTTETTHVHFFLQFKI